MRMTLLFLITAVSSLIGCAGASADEGGGSLADSVTVNGSVVLRDPVALPVGTLLTVTLEDVSLADSPAETLAQKQFEVKDQQAIPFSLVFPASAVRPGSVYAARARLTLGDRLLFTTTERNQVDLLLIL